MTQSQRRSEKHCKTVDLRSLLISIPRVQCIIITR